jgi:hypothetical protein
VPVGLVSGLVISLLIGRKYMADLCAQAVQG